MKNKKPSSTKKYAALVVVILLVAGAGGAAYWHARQAKPAPAAKPTAQANSAPDLSPPTEQEKQETDDHKAAIAQPAPASPAPAPANTGSDKRNVTPVISYWGQNPQTKAVEVSSYVGGIYENGGTCTLVLTKTPGGATASQSASGKEDATTTTCGTISIARAALTAGTWNAVVRYQSAAASGTSQSQRIEVQ